MMDVLQGNEVFRDYLENSLHEETQVEDESVSLTAGNVEELTGPGHLDFGGSEFQLANRHEVEPINRNEEDDYGWWSLAEGNYLLEFNETIDLSQGEKAVVQPHHHLYWNGVSHPTIIFTPDDTDMSISVPLNVGHNGVEIKENARVSTLMVIK